MCHVNFLTKFVKGCERINYLHMNRSSNKSTVARRARILDEIDSKGQVSVAELSRTLKVSEVTIRNDLAQLERQNMLIRARGGAIKIKLRNIGVDSPLSDKMKENFREKQLIGQAAAKLVSDGDTIILDSGTTTAEIAKNLGQYRDLTIITNALNVANILAENFDFNVFMPGGFLRKKSLSLVGSIAEEIFNRYYCDKLFLGVDGIDVKHGLSTPNVEEAHVNSIMIDIAKKVIVVTDSSKFFRRRFALIAPLSKIHTLVTDSGITDHDKLMLEQAGIEVIIA
jgi:DeoR family transcriptional regulator of aga operon